MPVQSVEPFSLVIDGTVPIDVVVGGVVVVFGVMVTAGKVMWSALQNERDRTRLLEDRNLANVEKTLTAIYALRDAMSDNARALDSLIGSAHGGSGNDLAAGGN